MGFFSLSTTPDRQTHYSESEFDDSELSVAESDVTTPSVAGDGTPRELVVEETGRLAGSAGTGGGAHMEGYLAKRRTTKWPHVWQQRYVVVHGDEMTWSKSKNSELLGRVRLSDFAWNSAVPRSSNELSFSAHQSNKNRTRTFLFKSKSQAEIESWRVVLNSIMETQSPATPLQSPAPTSSQPHYSLATAEAIPEDSSPPTPLLTPFTGLGFQGFTSPLVEDESSSSRIPDIAHSACTEVETGADATWDTAPAESVSAQEDAHSSPGPTRRLSGADDGAPPASLAVTSFEIVSDGAVSSKVASAENTLTVTLRTSKPVHAPSIFIGPHMMELTTQVPTSHNAEWKACLSLQGLNLQEGDLTPTIGVLQDEEGCSLDNVTAPTSVRFLPGPPVVTSIQCKADGKHGSEEAGPGDSVSVSVRFNREVAGVAIRMDGELILAEPSTSKIDVDNDDCSDFAITWCGTHVLPDSSPVVLGPCSSAESFHLEEAILVQVEEGFHDIAGNKGIQSKTPLNTTDSVVKRAGHVAVQSFLAWMNSDSSWMTLGADIKPKEACTPPSRSPSSSSLSPLSEQMKLERAMDMDPWSWSSVFVV